MAGIARTIEISDEDKETLLKMTHWSARRLAKQAGVGKTTVHRIWQVYDLNPHRVETFKFSDDPQLKGNMKA